MNFFNKIITHNVINPNLQWAEKEGYSYRPAYLYAIRTQSLTLVETQQPSYAEAIFSIQAWHYAPCQIIFFTKPTAPHLNLSDTVLTKLIKHERWRQFIPQLITCDVQAFCTVGHDGAWLKFVFMDKDKARLFESKLIQHCAQANITLYHS